MERRLHADGWFVTDAGTNMDILKSSQTKIEMLFPEGKLKTLILSFDDGRDADRRLVKLFEDLEAVTHIPAYLDRVWDYANQSRHTEQTPQGRLAEMLTEGL